MTSHKSMKFALAASTLMSPLLAAPAFAADKVEDIIVTAQKREEKVQEVPIAITALGAEQLETRGVNTATDLSALAPNLTVGAGTAGANDITISMRGLPNQDALLTQDGPVGIYIDGVINARIAGAITDLVDLERVEVLRGPQGTLYGRNTTGGAVNFITRKPSKDFQVTQKFGYQTFGGITSRTAIDTGEWGDTGLSATINFLYKKIGGYYDNLAAKDKDDPGSENVRAGRFALNYNNNGRFRANFQIIHSESENGNLIGQLTGVSPAFRAAAVSLPVITTDRRDEVFYPGNGTDDVILTMHNFTAEYDLSDNLLLKSITGYRRFQDSSAGPTFGELTRYRTLGPGFTIVTASGYPYFATKERTHEQFTEELQLNGQYGDKVAGGDRLNFTLGAYTFTEHGTERSPQSLLFATSVPVLGAVAFPVASQFAYNTTTESWAVFGQASVTPNILADKLRLTAGLRYSADEKETTLLPGVNRFVPVVQQRDEKFNALTYLAKAQYFLSDDANAYVSYARGYKAGGFNTRSTKLEPFRPEKLNSLEAGLKASWLDRRLQTNVAAFFNEAVDQQVSQFIAGPSGAVAVVTNAGKSEYTGLEFEIVAKPVDGVTLDWSMGFVNPKYKKYLTADPANLAPFDASKVARFPYTSQTTGSAGVQYDSTPIAAMNDGKLQARVEAVWQSKQDFHPAIVYPSGAQDNPLIDATTSDARTVVNARIALRDVSLAGMGRVDFALWGKNLLDEEYVVQGIDFGALGFAVQTFGAPMTAGLEVVFRY